MDYRKLLINYYQNVRYQLYTAFLVMITAVITYNISLYFGYRGPVYLTRDRIEFWSAFILMYVFFGAIIKTYKEKNEL